LPTKGNGAGYTLTGSFDERPSPAAHYIAFRFAER
jgi:hypothetical protein